MKISEVQAIPLQCPTGACQAAEGEFLITPLHALPNVQEVLGAGFVGLRSGPVSAVIVLVKTDDGISGIGSVGVGSGAAVYIIEQHLRPILLGKNPFDVEVLWETMFRSTLNYGRKGVVLEAISAVDIALWDIMGKALKQPIYNLLGGKTRDKIRVYASRLYAEKDLDALARKAEGFVKQGFTALKQRFGYGPQDGMSGMRRNIALVRAVRDAVGPDVALMADAYMGWNVSYAIKMIRMLEDAGVNLDWVEEPLIPDDIDGYALLRRSVRTPISAGEHEFSRYGFNELIKREAVDILQPDVNRVGGITEARKIWAMAAANNLAVIPHAGQLHNYHLVMANLNSPMAEYFPGPAEGAPLDDDTLFWEIFEGEPTAFNGAVVLYSEPGLGLRLRDERISQWRGKTD
ncbi:MAG TPA: enolase C-terminal domain-like protein [Terriglobia bacterium]|nr:enolase C-terminal domain-like protein [Terriglobia bacterium]